MVNEDGLKEILRKENPEFRKIFDEHHLLDRKITKIIRRKTPTPQEERQQKRLQIEKLHAKDRMEVILREHRNVRSL